jgi:hypothetical protein
MSCPRWVAVYLLPAALLPAVFSPQLVAQETVRLQEKFTPGYQYHVESTVRLSGTLAPPAEKGKPAPAPLKMTGESVLKYDERTLELGATGIPQKTLRLYRQVELQKSDGQQQLQATVRPEVRRLVIVRLKSKEVPFSPDGPLTGDEIDLIRTDVFTPALAGLFSPVPVKPGDHWPANRSAVEELTDLEEISEGGLDCTFEKIEPFAGRRHALVRFKGSVKGVDEDGPIRHQFDGFCYFDLESNHLSYISFKAAKSLLDAGGQEHGHVEGQFVLTRQANCDPPELRPESLRGLVLDISDDNTLIRYDNPELGVRLVHPRRWRVSDVRVGQLMLEEPKGGGVLVTLEPPARVPTAAQFLEEAQNTVAQKKGKLLGRDDPRRLRGGPQELDQFALSVELDGKRALLDYYVLRQALGGATVFGYLPAGDEQAALSRDVTRIVNSITLTKAITAEPKK